MSKEIYLRTMEGRTDAILALWLILVLMWDVLVWGTWTYLVFWCGASGWWALLALLLTHTETLYKVLKRRFIVPKDEY
mgnify:CR=1 FL=1